MPADSIPPARLQLDPDAQFRFNFRGLRAPPVIEDDPDGLVRIIRDRHQVEIGRADKPARLHGGLHPTQQPPPETAPDQDEGKLRYPLRLHQGDQLEKIVQRAESARHEDESDAVLDEANLSGKEVVKVDRDVRITISVLLVRQLDVQSDGLSP